MSEQNKELIPNLFRKEFTKMVAVISKRFGLRYIETAEDIVSETFLLAAETWGMKGIPNNPSAWLYSIAKNKTIDYLRRNKLFNEKISPNIKATASHRSDEEDFSDFNFSHENITDSQLQMMFAVCNPIIASEAQISLALRILCGLGIDEIAEAFLTQKGTINKRLYRAKEKLREHEIKMEFPPDHEIEERLDNVLHIIYLLFNEGYYSVTQNETLRKDLSFDAMRLCYILINFEKTNTPKTNALMALMCFNASRFNARINSNGDHLLYDDQDKNLWDDDLIEKGDDFLNRSATGSSLTAYHLEAGIAHWHSRKQTHPDKWENILQLYNRLLQINYSSSVALNRTYALYRAKGPEVAIAAAEQLELKTNHFYYTLLGEMYASINPGKARENYELAIRYAHKVKDQELIRQKIEKLLAEKKSEEGERRNIA